MSAIEGRRLLVQELASSSYLNKSARLREMFLYLCGRVLDEGADDIHEHEVGHRVFGRPADYDTSIDNIVRVHASMLRKRVDQYFANEGRREPIIIDIPKGNYAPVFRKRPASPPPSPSAIITSEAVEPTPTEAPASLPASSRFALWMWLPSALAVIFACTTVFLLVRTHNSQANAAFFANQPSVRHFWSQIFHAGTLTDIVLDDASLGFFQELTDREIPLSQYFDRSYLRSVEDIAVAAKLNPELAKSLVLKRQSSYADVALFWKLNQTANALQANARTHFARDYSFREIKANNAVLLGNSRSNPWIEPFEAHLTLRWKFNKSLGTYYPVDTTTSGADQQKFQVVKDANKPQVGYASVSFLPNLSGTGKVLIISATGGSAMTAALDLLSDENAVAQLRARLPKSKTVDLPYFETLLKIESRSALPRDTTIVICRPLQP